MPNIKQILSHYKAKQILVRLAEEYIWWIIKNLPGFEGAFLRYLFLKATAKKLTGFCWISQGCRISNSYGLSIGKNFTTNVNVLIDGIGGIEIGDNAGIGPNCVLISQGHNMLSKYGFIGGDSYKNAKQNPIMIGSDVWIGANCFIKAGIALGDKVVVGACSNVVANVPAYTTVLGSPARPYPQVMREFLMKNK